MRRASAFCFGLFCQLAEKNASVGGVRKKGTGGYLFSQEVQDSLSFAFGLFVFEVLLPVGKREL